MAAGLIDKLCGMDDLYEAVTTHAARKAERKRRDTQIAKLIERLKRGD
jgi:hypothetical protein